MKNYPALLLLFAAVCSAQESEDHKNELAFGLGGIPAMLQSDSSSLGAGSGIAHQPSSRISPYAAVGGGYAGYEQSIRQIDGQPNRAPRELARGVFDFGAGVDVQVWRFVALRGEARDFSPITTLLRSRVGSTTS